MTLISSNIVPIKLLGDVFLKVNNKVLFPFAMIMHVVVIFLQRKLLQKSCSADFIGLLFSKTLMCIVALVTDAKD